MRGKKKERPFKQRLAIDLAVIGGLIALRFIIRFLDTTLL